MAAKANGAFRATESFAPAARKDEYPRIIRAGDLIASDDPIVKTHRALLQPVDEYIEQTTQAPGEVRPIRLPSGVTQEEAIKHREGHAHRVAADRPHPPEHEDSPASPFAPLQPGGGVVADDVPPEQNPAGGPKAADAPAEAPTPQPVAKTAKKK